MNFFLLRVLYRSSRDFDYHGFPQIPFLSSIFYIEHGCIYILVIIKADAKINGHGLVETSSLELNTS